KGMSTSCRINRTMLDQACMMRFAKLRFGAVGLVSGAESLALGASSMDAAVLAVGGVSAKRCPEESGAAADIASAVGFAEAAGCGAVVASASAAGEGFSAGFSSAINCANS